MSTLSLLKKLSTATVGTAIVGLGVLGTPAMAVTLYQGFDPGIEPGQSRPNSDAAAANFDSDAAALGSVNLIDFENLTPGNYSTLTLGSGVTATWLNPNPYYQSISQLNNSLTGYNTTSGGSKFLSLGPGNPFAPVSLTLAFANPIQSWGAYFTGVQGAIGKYLVQFSDGSLQSLSLAEDNFGGVQFLGFTASGKSISSITIVGKPDSIGQMGDIIGLDDMRYVYAPSDPTQSVPEPTSVLSLLGFSAFGVSSLLKRQQKMKG
ncbi:MAG TPA: hypothetical protein DDZ80_12990 [Cyanobacteria bacterium UBA8803]|nr:hypothetical protein [Cyanobacteria bacterium UBA9273]HBL59390.1 hypothetical protein [Cyanobacteria bacterium UBA8803]